MRFLFAISFLFCSLLCSYGQGGYGRYTSPLAISSDRPDPKSITIYIDKTDHTLTITREGEKLKEYKCVFGVNPVADKKCEGDKCTPEGEFHILAKYPHPDWDKFMLIDYPTAQSKAKFNANKAHGIVPPDATIGGSIGIHGVPRNKPYLIDKGVNWTWGCISLSNEDIDEIYNYVGVGTRVIIAK